MSLVEISTIIYGLLLLSGAYFGYKAGSKVSLNMGITSGIFVFIGFFLAGQDPQFGYASTAVISGLLAVVFLIRLIKTKKMMPAGMLLGVSVINFVITFCHLTKL